MKKIILPTDFSANAQKAMDYAIYLFKNEPCKFYLLHAYHSAPSAPSNKLTLENDLRELAKTLKADRVNAEHRFKAIVLTDSVISALQQTIREKKADYVFMGTKGSSAIREIFMGSNTVSVIKYLDTCPIMAVPANYGLDMAKEILFANDLKHAFKLPELKPLIDIAKLGDSTLTVVHIDSEEGLSEEQKMNKERLERNLEGVKSQFLEVDMLDSMASTIFQLQRENKNIGMVVLLKNKHGYFNRLIREPVIRNIAFKTELPFLVLAKV